MELMVDSVLVVDEIDEMADLLAADAVENDASPDLDDTCSELSLWCETGKIDGGEDDEDDDKEWGKSLLGEVISSRPDGSV